MAIALSCTGVALFVGACVAGSTAFTIAVGEFVRTVPISCRCSMTTCETYWKSVLVTLSGTACIA